ncbi:membrane protein insertion efficiency factor YidD [Deinococcus maricopensis]|uniref:Membrane protein insertion efficiency factor YidD n=1 Tax=Deinococcus maricopensis (strain DSM 21211 / LMG 22137 / NRRL B-23946 / LB-34) TaxID=709986 RepID=E8U531_DEIML|nr:membrane protein insertion efficiency factor YidD [Deinococcus maricopensis]ADV66170.1 protein of unknown function DUF37 [Deinococcus maricopensis DSM 21211]
MNTTTLALRSIRGYQRYLSPLKGFRCAHAAYHGGLSCSAAISRIVEARGVLGGWPDIQAQFAACRAAHDALRASARVDTRGVFCCGPIPIPFRCG